MKILAATNNKNKIIEFKSILSETGIPFVSPDEIGGIPDVHENGLTFEENASIKALAAAKFAKSFFQENGEKLIALADDSGLEVEALNGAPGIYSARYANTNDKRIAKILKELEGVENRKAKFVCAAALADENSVIAIFRGEVYGMIGYEPKGIGGFGYDPIFYPDGYSLTFGELGPKIKDKISHRFKALKKTAEFLKGIRPNKKEKNG